MVAEVLAVVNEVIGQMMMLIWYLISDEARVGLAKLFRKLAGYDFIPPVNDYRPFTVKGKFESQEEIDRLMRQRPKGRLPK